MPAIRQLFDLQSVDLDLDQRKARLSEIAPRLGDESSLKPLREEVARLQGLVARASAQQAEHDIAIAALDERIASVEKKLYGGAVRLPRELQDLQADIAMITRQRSEREDNLLVVLEELEQAQQALAGASAALAEAQGAWESEQAALAEEQRVIEAEVAKLHATRNARAGGVPATELALYEHVRKGHAGRAVAQMRNGTCTSCRVALPTSQAASVRAGEAPVRCPNCGLILLAD